MATLDVMTRDFRVVDAGWSRTRALEAVSRFTCAYVIVRRRDAPGADPRYYVCHRADVESELARSLAANAGAALRLYLKTPNPTVELTAGPGVAAEDQVVLYRGVPAGVIVAAASHRGGTAIGDRVGAPAAAPPAEAAAALTREPATRGEEAIVTRNLSGTLPGSVGAGAEIALLVSLASQAVPPLQNIATAALSVPLGTKLDIVIEPVEGLRLVGSGIGMLEVRDPQPPQPLLFKLTAADPGAGRLRVHAFSGGFALASLELSTTIEAQAKAAEPGPGESASAQLVVVPRVRPDLSMYIFEAGNEITFRLQSPDGRFEMQTYGPVRLAASSREHFRGFFKDVENLAVETPHEREIAKRKLEQKGANLFETIFPAELKATLWELRDRISTLQITSEEAWIPWEVCQLTGKGPDGAVQQGKFFAEAFSVTRWLYGVSAAPRIRFSNWGLVVSQDSFLPKARDEEQFVSSLNEAGRKVNKVPATYLDLTDAMATGAYDAWHFTGHARADQNNDADMSAIELNSPETLKPEDIVGVVENVLRPRPFVFLNACQSAQGGLTLTGVGGWAHRFLKPNSSARAASAFIGSYWSVYDEAAHGFAKALYQGLFAGKSIGQAVREARSAVRTADDPLTWLAYTVYADPAATVDAR